MKEISIVDFEEVMGGVGTAGAPPMNGSDLIVAGREAASFINGFLNGFYAAF
jgi:hypothetical protein